MKKIWELDFYFHPIFSENNKKLWEIVICETPIYFEKSFNNYFRFSQLCSSSTVNSIWLSEAIKKAIQDFGKSPDLIRFFRHQMHNMIIKASSDAELIAIPSGRTYTLNHWMNKRHKDFNLVKIHQNINKNITIIANTDFDMIPLSDTLRGNQFNQYVFVNLEVSAFNEIHEWDISFGESFAISLYDLPLESEIPGLLFFSQRALPIAAWLSSFDLVSLRFDQKTNSILYLETGLNNNSVLTTLSKIEFVEKAQKFEKKKRESKGIHFLAIQPNPDVDFFSGFWLLKDNHINYI